MSNSRGDLIVVGCLDEAHEGRYARIPRHVTVMPWFSLDNDTTPDLFRQLSFIAAHHAPINITGAHTDQFGPDHDVLVRRLEYNDDLMRLHHDCLVALRSLKGVLRRDEYTGDHYQPHVTKQHDGWMGEGERRIIPRLQLFQSIDTGEYTRDLIAQFDLGGSHENAA